MCTFKWLLACYTWGPFAVLLPLLLTHNTEKDLQAILRITDIINHN